MLIQAAGLALLAALSPTALLIAAIYLGSARPRLVTAFYLAGALLMSLVMGVILLAVLRNAGLQRAAPAAAPRPEQAAKGNRVQVGGRPGAAERVPRRPPGLRARDQLPRRGTG